MAQVTSGSWTTALLCLALSLVLQACVPQQGVRRQPMDTAAPAPVIVSFEAHPPGLTEGGTTTLKWRTRDAVSVNISGVGNVPPTGSRVVEPRGRNSYLLTASNRSGQIVSEEIRIGAIPLMGHVSMPPMIFFFKAEPPHVMAGDTTTLTWRVENAERVEISGLGQVPPSGARSVEPREQSHFQLSAISSDGKRSTAELLVGIAQPMVIEPPPRFEQPVIKPAPRLERPVIVPAQRVEQAEIRRIQPNDRQALRAMNPATMQVLRILPAPLQKSPRAGSRFSHHPRQTRLQWTPVKGAASYTVEIDCYQCCRSNAWCTDTGKAYKVQPSLRATSYNFNFAGAQPGRWRVWAVDKNGKAGAKSGWWDFSYTR